MIYQVAVFYPNTKEDDVYEWELARFLNDIAFMKDKSEWDIEIKKEQMKNVRY